MSLSLPNLLGALPEAVFVLDAELRYVFVNRRAAELIGADADALAGRPFPDVPIPGTDPETVERYRSAIATGTPETLERLHQPAGQPAGRCLEHRLKPVDHHLLVAVSDVTERKREEEALRRKAVVFDAAGDILILTDEKGIVQGWNPAAEQALGYTAREATGRPVSFIFPDSDGDAVVRTVIGAVAREGEWSGELWVTRKDATRRLLQGRVRAVRDPGGRMIGTVGVSRDITDRQDAAEELAALLRAMEDVVLVIDRDGRYRRVAPVKPELLFRPSDELVGRTFRDLLAPDQATQFEAAVTTALTERRTVQVDYAMTIDGARHWFHAALSPLDEDHVVWVARDVTDRRQALERLETFLDTIPDQAWMKDRDGRYVVVNQAYARARGLSRDEVLGRTDAELFPEPLATRFAAEDAAILESGTRSRVEDRMRAGDGPPRWFEVLKAPVRDETGTVVGTVGVSRDITDRKQAEERVRQQALLFQTTTDAVIYTDAQGRISAWNPGAERIFGYTAEEAKGQKTEGLLLSRDDLEGDLGATIGEALRRRGGWQGELALRRKDGAVARCEVAALPLLDAREQLTGGISVIRDVSHRHALEEQLRQSQKLEAVGRLAGGIAHDFNNMLLVIQGFASLLQAEIGEQENAAEYLEEIRNAAERSARLTRQLLAYSRKQILQPDLLDLNRTVTGLETLLLRTLGEDVTLETDLDPALASVRADPSQMEQMLLNLALNARDAMPAGGRLVIRTRARTITSGDGAGDSDGNGEIPPGDYVELAVQDTGHGMEAEVLEHVFEPFFTTKPVGAGTGLGLATVYGIVRQSGGFVWAESRPGRGTTFRVLLPPAEAPAPATTPSPGTTAEPATPAGSPPAEATLLLVEDEPAVRDLLQRVLERGGFAVLAAATGDEALALAEREADALDAAVIDVVLPGMSGRVVADRLLEQRHDLPILFLSGYTDDHVLRHGISRAERHFLQKPVPPDVLVSRVRKLLQEG